MMTGVGKGGATCRRRRRMGDCRQRGEAGHKPEKELRDHMVCLSLRPLQFHRRRLFFFVTGCVSVRCRWTGDIS